MRRIQAIAIVLLMIITLILAACGGGQAPTFSQEQLGTGSQGLTKTDQNIAG